MRCGAFSTRGCVYSDRTSAEIIIAIIGMMMELSMTETDPFTTGWTRLRWASVVGRKLMTWLSE